MGTTKSRARQHLKIISRKDDWETPPGMLREACKKHNVWPRVDAAATEDNKQCEEILKDGLEEDWYLDTFCNPPYTEKEKWIKHAYEQHKKHNITVIMLMFSKTEVKWWHRYVKNKAKVDFIEGRVNFYWHGKPAMIWDKKAKKWRKGAAPYGSCWIIWRKRKRK